MDYYDPHIVFGFWIRPEISNNDIFSPVYQVFRQDRTDGYGGGFLACHRSLACQQISLNANCEMVTCKMHLKANNKSLIVLSV